MCALAIAATWHASDKNFHITGNHYLHIYPGNPKEVLVGDGIHAEPLGILLGAQRMCSVVRMCSLIQHMCANYQEDHLFGSNERK